MEKNDDVITLCAYHLAILAAEETESRFPPHTNPPKELLVFPCIACLEMASDIGRRANKEVDGIDIDDMIKRELSTSCTIQESEGV